MNRLYKSRKYKVVAGVCGGVAEYLSVDPVLIRLIAVVFFFTGGASLIAYIVGMIIMPERPRDIVGFEDNSQTPPSPPSQSMENSGAAGSLIIGIILIALGGFFLLRNIPYFHYFYWWFWNMGWHYLWPSILILIGLLIIFREYIRKSLR